MAQKPLEQDVLRRFAGAVRGQGRVADVGCGPAQVARFLADLGVDACGVDLSPKMVEAARARNPDLDVRVGDMLALPFGDGSLAGAVAFYSLIHIPRGDVPVALGEFRRVLRPDGGALLLVVHRGEGELYADDWRGTPINIGVTLFELDELVGLVTGAGFDVVETLTRPPEDYEVQHDKLFVWAHRGQMRSG